MNQDNLLKKIKQAVLTIERDAEIILYGSRSRGDSASESDWDLLILVDGEVNDERTNKIRYQLYEVEWESGEILSSIIRSRNVWNSSPYRAMPLHRNIEREGLIL
jgi:uncharacterized protein